MFFLFLLLILKKTEKYLFMFDLERVKSVNEPTAADRSRGKRGREREREGSEYLTIPVGF